MKRTTLKDIAKEAGVGISTVSMALNDCQNINVNTRKRIQDLAKKMNYQPNIIARAMVGQRTSLIGVVIPNIESSFYPEILEGFEEVLYEKLYSTILCVTNHSHEKESFYLDLLFKKNVDGIVMEPSQEFIEDEMEKYSGPLSNVPFVCAFQGFQPDKYPNVTVDNVLGGKLAAQQLLDIDTTNTLFIGGGKEDWFSKRRLKGFVQRYSEAGRSVPEEDCFYADNYTYEAGREVAQHILENYKKPFDSIFCASDILAVGVMQKLVENGYSVPGQVSIIGFDDIPIASIVETPLTTIAQPKYEMGQVIGRKLLSLIDNPDNKVANVVMEPKLVVRNSTRGKS